MSSIRGDRRAAVLVVALLGLIIIGWALGCVVQDLAPGAFLDNVDGPVLRFFATHRQPWLTTTMQSVTRLGSSAVLVPMLVVVAAAWRWRRDSWSAGVLLAVSYVGAVLVTETVKRLVSRPRPPTALAIGHFSGFAFPSGHATQAVVAWGALAFVTARAWPRAGRYHWLAVAAVVAMAVDLSRLYLGAHWLTDVVVGSLVGGAWLVVVVRTIGYALLPVPLHHQVMARDRDRCHRNAPGSA
ncbi:MAG: phosphatase PAP2 family protein [Acidimicrobiia bacterium]|nr:phosphatase PAP2 family protein [Acidimicrobiia bacterium]